jgi:signal peptidase I
MTGNRLARSWRIVIVVATCLGLVGIGVITWFRRRLVVVTVSGESMYPTHVDGDRVVVQRTALCDVRPGQIVVAEPPDPDMRWTGPPADGRVAGRQWMIKRAAAVPGDPVPRVPAFAKLRDTHVPDDLLLVLGDNAEGSYDSRQFGYVPGQRVLGVVVRRLAGG